MPERPTPTAFDLSLTRLAPFDFAIGQHERPGPRAPALSRAAWLDPPGQTSPSPLPDGAASVHYLGPVSGAWGGHCLGRGHVRSVACGFDAELALDAGDAIHASLRAGGHQRHWVLLDDPRASPDGPLVLRLRFSLEGELCSALRAPRGWGADPGGGVFIGTEDAEHHPLGLRLRLDAQRSGTVARHEEIGIVVPNGRWLSLPLRFATRIHSSLDQPLAWRLRARMNAVAAGGDRVRLQVAASRGDPGTPASDAASQRRRSARSDVTRSST